MALIHKTKIKEVASNKPNAATAFNLPATAPTGFRTFVSEYTSTQKLTYHATNGTDWESGIGTFTDGTPDTITRTKVFESTNADAAVDFSAGADVTVFVTNTAYLANTGAVLVESSTTTQSIATATFTKIAAALATEVTDEMGWWDHGNSKFLPDVEGWYMVGGLVSLTSIADQKFIIIAVYKNGAEESFVGRQTCSTATSVTNAAGGMIPVYLNGTTDYVELYAYHNDTVSRSTEGTAKRINFRAYRIGG